nr:Transposable element Tc3 transposase putative [Albugo laibachii Nc14]|eukprot:CCA25049.1 Transposable element Tc3 transposase putative [Albugo laibachii Nc14]
MRELGLLRAVIFDRQVLLCFEPHLLVEPKVASEDLDARDASFGKIGSVDGEAARIHQHLHFQSMKIVLATVKRILLATVADRAVALLKDDVCGLHRARGVAKRATGRNQKLRGGEAEKLRNGLDELGSWHVEHMRSPGPHATVLQDEQQNEKYVLGANCERLPRPTFQWFVMWSTMVDQRLLNFRSEKVLSSSSSTAAIVVDFVKREVFSYLERSLVRYPTSKPFLYTQCLPQANQMTFWRHVTVCSDHQESEHSPPLKTCKLTGPKPLLSDHDIRRIARAAAAGESSAAMLKHEVNISASARTIQRTLARVDWLEYTKMVNTLPLTAADMLHRVAWAKIMLLRKDAGTVWESIIFSDAKKWNLDGTDGFQHYWRDLRLPARQTKRRQADGGSVMVWGVFGALGFRILSYGKLPQYRNAKNTTSPSAWILLIRISEMIKVLSSLPYL